VGKNFQAIFDECLSNAIRGKEKTRAANKKPVHANMLKG